MNFGVRLTATLTLASIALIADPAMAKTVPIKNHSKGSVRNACSASGGIFWPPGKESPTYGCVNGDGSGIVCSGVTAKQKKTCDTFRLAPRHYPFPTREEAGAKTEQKK